mgnify:CR=1 FL=1
MIFEYSLDLNLLQSLTRTDIELESNQYLYLSSSLPLFIYIKEYKYEHNITTNLVGEEIELLPGCVCCVHSHCENRVSSPHQFGTPAKKGRGEI